jgi:hypothetical protein
MKTLRSPRRVRSIRLGRPILYKEVRGTSARGHCTLRVLNPPRKRSVPLAAPRQVDPQDHAWEKHTWRRLDRKAWSFNFVLAANQQPMLVELSYRYIPELVYQCTGHWDDQFKW